MKAVESNAPTREEAIEKALSELGVEMYEVDKIEILDEGSKGVLGFGKRDVKVKVIVEALHDDKPEDKRPARRPDRDQNSEREQRREKGRDQGRNRGGRDRNRNDRDRNRNDRDRKPQRDRNEEVARRERPERGERPPRKDRNDRSERPPRKDRNDRSERPPRKDREERSERGERSVRKPQRKRNEEGSRRERPAQGERQERGERSVRKPQRDRKPQREEVSNDGGEAQDRSERRIRRVKPREDKQQSMDMQREDRSIQRGSLERVTAGTAKTGGPPKSRARLEKIEPGAAAAAGATASTSDDAPRSEERPRSERKPREDRPRRERAPREDRPRRERPPREDRPRRERPPRDETPLEPLTDEQGKNAAVLLQEIIQKMGMEATVEYARADDETARLNVESEDQAILIGRKGRTLSSLQYIINRVAFAHDSTENTERLVVDVGGYIDRRRESLEDMARNMADKAKDTGRNMRLKPMTPQERRIIHMTLAEDDEIRTFSLGDSLYRSVVIAPRDGNGGGRGRGRDRNNEGNGDEERRPAEVTATDDDHEDGHEEEENFNR